MICSQDSNTDNNSPDSQQPGNAQDDAPPQPQQGGKRVLRNINHDFHADKVHAITGPSDAGKTTMIADFQAYQSHGGKSIVQRQRSGAAG